MGAPAPAPGTLAREGSLGVREEGPYGVDSGEGVNHLVWHGEEALALAGPGRMACNQVLYPGAAVVGAERGSGGGLQPALGSGKLDDGWHHG
jgi:hypothetical protein